MRTVVADRIVSGRKRRTLFGEKSVSCERKAEIWIRIRSVRTKIIPRKGDVKSFACFYIPMIRKRRTLSAFSSFFVA